VHPVLFRILCAFLDQGIAIQSFPIVNKSFIDSMKGTGKKKPYQFFQNKSCQAKIYSRRLLCHQPFKNHCWKEEYFEQYLFDQQFSHHGWSGFISAVEDNPQTLLDKKSITLKELVEFELLMELDALNTNLKDKWQPLALQATEPSINLFADIEKTELAEVIELWQDAFEWSYYDSVLKGILMAARIKQDANNNAATSQGEERNPDGLLTPKVGQSRPSFQSIFCIDEREDSIRRHIEAVDKKAQTLGAPGFFGVEFYFQQQGSKFYDKLCPAPVTPKYLIKESEADTGEKMTCCTQKIPTGL
jgi:uncharacterized protein YbcC (UPF0753/DUF2309 family)